MKASLAIAARELRSLFLSPLAWTLLAILQALSAWLFLVRMDGFAALQPRLAELEGAPGITLLVVTPLFRSVALMFTLLVPLVGMRLLSGERREGTLVLLLAAPVSAASIVIGKFLATMTFFVGALALVTCTPLALLLGGSLDTGLMLAALLGMTLLVASFSAISLLFSSLCEQPATAASGSAGVLVMLWLLDWAAAPRDGAGFTLLTWLSPAPHLDAMLRGLVDSADIAYFVVVSAACLLLATRRVEAFRAWD